MTNHGMGEIRLVEINRDASAGFGFSILGGAGSHLPPIVYDILDDSPAAITGEVQTGDIILEVNGRPVFNLSTKEVLRSLRLSKGSVLLTLKRDELVSDRVREYLRSPNTLDSLRSAITERDLHNVRDVVAMKSVVGSGGGPLIHQQQHNSPSVPVVHSPPGRRTRTLPPPGEEDSLEMNGSCVNGGGSNGLNSSGGERPRYEAFTMTGDVMLSLSRTPVNPAAMPCVPPLVKQTTPTPPPVPSRQLPRSSPASTAGAVGDDVTTNGSGDVRHESTNGVASNSEESHATAAVVLPCSDTDDVCAAESSQPLPSPSASLTSSAAPVREQRDPSATSDVTTAPPPSSCPTSDELTVAESSEQQPPSRPASTASSGDHPYASAEDIRSPEEAVVAETAVEEDGDSDSLSSIQFSPRPTVDVPSAIRLAKRLYELDGFKKSDVSRHLSKNNLFNHTVADEYLKHFDFVGWSLDAALRRFLDRFVLAGETQERERVLVHFSQRFVANNPQAFNSSDACHTLTCALMLLNTDLHVQRVPRKMTCTEFIDNLSELNDGRDFQRDVLKSLYQSIKAQPLQYGVDAACDAPSPDSGKTAGSESAGVNGGSTGASAGSSVGGVANPSLSAAIAGGNPFLEVPDASKATEYKRGYVMRKCCLEPNGKRTGVGKRSWRMFYCTLRDLILFMHKDENSSRHPGAYSDAKNAIRVHHALACKATNYFKKEHVFRLQTADRAEYLLQTSDGKELQAWVDALNFVSASLSAAPLSAPVGSQKKFQRPLLPSALTNMNLREQLTDQESRLSQIQQELTDMESNPPAKNSRSHVLQTYRDKYTHLQYELERYNVYVELLRSKMLPHLLVATAAPSIPAETTAAPLAEAAAVITARTADGRPLRRPTDSAGEAPEELTSSEPADVSQKVLGESDADPVEEAVEDVDTNGEPESVITAM